MEKKTKLITIDYEEYHSLQERANKNHDVIREKINKGVTEAIKQLNNQYKSDLLYEKVSLEGAIVRELYKLKRRFGYIKFSDMRQVIHEVFNDKN